MRSYWLVPVACIVLSSCTIVVVSGPSTVSVGDTVTYVLDVGSNTSGDSNVTLFVIADVPAGWNLLSSSYDGTLAGVPVSGVGSVVASTVCDFSAGDVPAGFQRLHVSAGPFPDALGTDTGTVTLEFQVDSQPASAFQIFFRFAGEGNFGGCSIPAVRTINREGGFLTFLQALIDGVGGVDGLASASSATVSHDGKHLLATARNNDSLAVFSRDTTTGELTFVEAFIDGVGGIDGLGSATAVAASSDGRHVYATGMADDALVAFSRDPLSGELAFIEALVDGVGGVDGLGSASAVAISPGGESVYTTSGEHAVAVFERDQGSGQLTFVEAFFDGVGGVERLEGVHGVAVSPDGLHVYTASSFPDSSVTVFSRDQTTGELALVQTVSDGVDGVQGLGGASSLAIPADGRHVYTSTDAFGNAVAVFARDATTGELTFVEAHFYGVADLSGVENPSAIAVDSIGRHVFVAGENSVAVFARNQATGELTFLEAQFDDDPPNQGLGGANALAPAPDGLHLYVASSSDNALSAFRTSQIFADGFESGDTSRW